jgi:hypothetical protein
MAEHDQLDSWLRLSQKLSEDERSIMQDEPCEGESVTEPSTSFLFLRDLLKDADLFGGASASDALTFIFQPEPTMAEHDQLDSWLRLSQKLSEDERSIVQPWLVLVGK